MQTAIEHFSGRTLVGRLVGTTPCLTVIESALGGSTGRILQLSMMGSSLFLVQLSDSISTDALLARSPISSGSRLLVFQHGTPQFDQDEFDRQQIPRFAVTLSFPSLPIFMRRCIPRMAARWGIVILGSFLSEIGTLRIQFGGVVDAQLSQLLMLVACWCFSEVFIPQQVQQIAPIARDGVFRLWETESWTSEKWSSSGGPVVSAMWSFDDAVLLMAFDQTTTLGALHFASKPPSLDVQLLPVELADIEAITGGNGRVEKMVWDYSGERLVISFSGGDDMHSGLVAVYDTRKTPILAVSLMDQRLVSKRWR
ncbi:hypothetical protein L7F22_066746 [Adiantum nelumboides]|nr:hypothetical protein [Adiantum nelumboides]